MKDDTISRREALDALEKEKPTPFVNKDGSVDPFGVGRQNQWYRDGIAIMNLPPADAVPVVHGRWINGKCDKCGGHAPFWAMATTYYPSNFCPHCGARMDGKEGDEHED